MERPRTGHGQQAGSITVVDLLRRHQSPVQTRRPGDPVRPASHAATHVGHATDARTDRASKADRTDRDDADASADSAADASTAELFVGDLLGGPAPDDGRPEAEADPPSEDRGDIERRDIVWDEATDVHYFDEAEFAEPAESRRGRGGRAATMIGLAASSLVLCGSMVAASVLSHDRKTSPAQQSPAQPTEFAGADVLRPAAIAAQLAARHPLTATTAPAPASHPHPPMAPDDHGPRHAGDGPGELPTSSHPAPPPGSSADRITISPADVVREFYTLAVGQPELAETLLDPQLDTDPLEFAASWDDVRQVRVDSVQPDPDGSVRAVVDLQQDDGSWLHLVELLRVTMGNVPVISGAELLSAQHG